MPVAPLAVLLFTLLGNPAGAQQQRPPGRDPGVPPEDVAADSATHVEGDPLPVRFDNISCLRYVGNGTLVAGDSATKELKMMDASGKLLATIKLPFGPEAVNLAPDGTLYCGGQGQLASLDQTGKIIRTASIPTHAESDLTGQRRPFNTPLRVSGIAASDQDVFVAIGSGWSTGSKSKLFRLSRRLDSPKLLVSGLRGCCQRCDIGISKGTVYLAENAAHRVVLYDREGTVLGKWGERDRSSIEGFGSCCNPMNIAFDAAGTLYTAESGLGRVKTYSPSGKYLGLVGYAGVERFTNAGQLAASCSNMAIAPTPDGNTVYVADIKTHKIRVLRKKK